MGWFRPDHRHLEIRTKNAFLGLQFSADGQVHYGWAEVRLSTEAWKGEAFTGGAVTAYAYNTVANQQILAGQTAVPEPATLGRLALGSLALGLRCRKEAG